MSSAARSSNVWLLFQIQLRFPPPGHIMIPSARHNASNRELISIKKRAAEHLSCCNSLSVEYADWFTRQQQTFIDAIKSVQVAVPAPLSTEITTISQYRALCQMAHVLSRSGKCFRQSDKLECFLEYWDRFCQLQKELVFDVLVHLDKVMTIVTSWLKPEVKEQLNDVRALLCEEYSEDFKFADAHNEKDNLYTYRLNVCDQRFLGLVSYIPYLMQYNTRICHLIRKLRILTVPEDDGDSDIWVWRLCLRHQTVLARPVG